MVAFGSLINRRRDARPWPRGGIWGGRPPGPALLLAALLAVAVPGVLVTACSGGQAGSGQANGTLLAPGERAPYDPDAT